MSACAVVSSPLADASNMAGTQTRGSAPPLSAQLAANESRWCAHLEGIRARDAESLARLYDESASILYGLAVRILGDPADAEEVVLDVYQKAWNKAGTFDLSRGTVLSWLTMMTRS